ncbi:MAG: aminoacyl-histidine dipeptidase [Flavobacteriales bacterium]|nr:aminoacyl-histidine dipeptidase [Bacteroidota bacterium]MCB9241502.1 aminoacyl-histidine dipeptidase [Flavobacteriales bacterium]
MSNVRNLEPKGVWNNFEDLNAVPRGSKKEERVIQFAKAFGEKLGLPTHVDAIGNVMISKPATTGMEDRKTVILQSHLDMVHQKNADTVFDFDQDGIQTYIDGDWVKAKGTTLGADNGMGVAAIMTLLASDDIPHPPIEALFTIDEETGMTGAFKLEKGHLKGSILLNLDTEDDDEFSIGCAGGMDTNTRKDFQQMDVKSGVAYRITVNGLKGGHSGVDIHLERGNANKIMNRLMYGQEKHGLRIAEIDGGSLRNAIPRESFATVVVDSSAYVEDIQSLVAEIKAEYHAEDPGLNIEFKETDRPGMALTVVDSANLVTTLYACHNGVFRMSRAIEGLVETSSSLARVVVKAGVFTTQSLQRSSLESGKWDVANTVAAPFRLIGCDVEQGGSYPGWAPNPESEIMDVLVHRYETLFHEKPKVSAIHAGLECGIIGERYPGLDMISFGPTIKGPHSPDERVNIASVQKFWKFLCDVLVHTPKA